MTMKKQTTKTVTERVEELRSAIREHQYRYYILDEPSVSDAEFDVLFRELQGLEEEHPELRSNDSPTARVGGIISERFEKTQHPMPMLSLGNAFHAEDLSAWRTGQTLADRGAARRVGLCGGAKV